MSITCDLLREITENPEMADLVSKINRIKSSMEHLDLESVRKGDQARDMVKECERQKTDEDELQRKANELEKWLKETHKLTLAPLEQKPPGCEENNLKEVK